MISLLVTDLDGTLWDADQRVPEETLAAIEQITRARVPILVATSRRPSRARSLLARNGLCLPGVFLDGSVGIDLSTGSTFYRCPFEEREARALLEAFSAARLEPVLFVERPVRDILVGQHPSSSPQYLRMVEGSTCAVDLGSALASESVLAFGVVGGSEAPLRALAARIQKQGSFSATVIPDHVVQRWTLTVRPPGVSKWRGAMAFCSAQGISPDGLLAVGDADNDLELLSNAAVGCALATGTERARAAAKHVIGRWAEVLRFL